MKGKVFVLHHHLNPGGVTQVIRVQCECLIEMGCEVTVLSGSNAEAPPDWPRHPSLSFRCFPLLSYLTPKSKPTLLDEQKKILAFLRGVLSPDSVLHVHNPTLGKNPLVALALDDLAREGFLIVKHLHDFAEDNRPELFATQHRMVEGVFKRSLAPTLYKNYPNVLYVLINLPDLERLRRAGISEESLFWIPNSPSLGFFDANSAPNEARAEGLRRLGMNPNKPLALYPVRAIARKNLGEFLLLASLFKDEANWAVSLSPRNPKERPQYEAWLAFARSRNIEVHFDLGSQTNYESLMALTDACITTSIREGFGLVFLEAWARGKALFGRNLPDLTEAMEKQGFCFDEFYNHLWVRPTDEQAKATLDLYESHYIKRLEAYESIGYSIRRPKKVRAEFATTKMKNGCVDFPVLPVSIQREVIDRTRSDPDYKKSLLLANPVLSRLGALKSSHIESHQKLVQRHYPRQRYASHLRGCYDKLEQNASSASSSANQPRRSTVESLLKSFLEMGSLHFM